MVIKIEELIEMLKILSSQDNKWQKHLEDVLQDEIVVVDQPLFRFEITLRDECLNKDGTYIATFDGNPQGVFSKKYVFHTWNIKSGIQKIKTSEIKEVKITTNRKTA